MIGSIGLMFVARFLFGIQQWAMVAVLARGTDAAAVGSLGYGLAVIVPLAGFFGLGIRQGIATDLTGLFGFRDYLYTRIALMAAMVGLAFAIFFAVVEEPDARQAALYLLLPKGIELMSEMAYGIFQRYRREVVISYSLILRAILGFAGFWVGMQLGGTLGAAILGWGLSWVVVYAAFDAPMMRRCLAMNKNDTVLRRGSLRAMMRMTVIQSPIAVGALVGNLGISAPRLLLEPVVSIQILGVFTAIFMLFQAANTLAVAILQLFMTPMARATQQLDIPKIARLVAGATALVLVGLAIMWGLFWTRGPWLLDLMYGPDYAQYDELLLQLAFGWAAAYLAIIFRYIITSMRSFRTGLLIDILTTATIIAACYLALRGSPDMGSLAVGFAVGQWGRLGLIVVVSAIMVRGRRYVENR